MRRSIVLCALLALCGTALADTTPTTTVAQVMVLEPGDVSYKLFHGAVWLEFDKAQTNYRWGGLQCKGRELSDNSIQLLYAAMRASDQVAIEYATSEYNGKTYRCVTGFAISKS